MISSSSKRELRRGFTTGSCATAAARAACRLLFSGQGDFSSIRIQLPEDRELEIPLKELRCVKPFQAEAGVIKDAGDDPDETHGALIRVLLERGRRAVFETRKEAVRLSERMFLAAGQGVGRVTLPGLKIPPGEPAVNPVPRAMIRENLEREMHDLGAELKPDEALMMTVSVPGGEAIAEKTFNPRLGIVGGISIIGTSGIVEPMSEDALKASILTELDVAFARNSKRVALTFGATGERSLKAAMLAGELPEAPIVIGSNYVGFLLHACAEKAYEEVIFGGALGKMIKIAGGIFQTHSHVADARAEIMTAYAALEGFPPQKLEELFEQVTTDACLPLLDNEGLREKVLDRILRRMAEKIMGECHAAFALRLLLTDGKGEKLAFYSGKERSMIGDDADAN